MATKPRVTPDLEEELLDQPALQAPSQQQLLHRYLNGELGSEQLARALRDDIRDRWPALEKERQEREEEEEQRAREEAGMNESVHLDEPVFVPAGQKPASKPPVGAGPATDEAPPTDSLNEAQIDHVLPVRAQALDDEDAFRPDFEFESDD